MFEDNNNEPQKKLRVPFSGRAVKLDSLTGKRQTIVNKEKRKSKRQDGSEYLDVQAIVEGIGLVRYSTSSKMVVEYLEDAQIPVRDIVIEKDWRGFFVQGTTYSVEEDEEYFRKKYGINY